MLAVFGLGNPGKRYANTRHNVGYRITDQLSGGHQVPFRAGKGDYYYAEIAVNGERVLLVKPTTYMNHSGLAVKQCMGYFPFGLEDLLVVYDDYHLPFGTLRFRPGGSDGGHNGVHSIIYHLQTEEFHRFRFGVGAPRRSAVDYVLSPFNRREQKELENLLPIAAEAVEFWVRHDIDKTMNTYNRTFINEE